MAIGARALLFLAASLGGAMLVGCGDDTTGTVPHDGGGDAQPPLDGSVVDGGGGEGGEAGEGGDAACNYATFVLGLINNHTNGTDQPSTDLGQSCVDDQNQTEFQSLFP
jgi:hypothetical protein